MENLPGIPTGTINMIMGKSIVQKDYLVRFTPKNHPRVKYFEMEMKEGDFLIEVPSVGELDEHSIYAVIEIINKIKLITEMPKKVEFENINGINYPITYFDDGVIIIDYPK